MFLPLLVLYIHYAFADPEDSVMICREDKYDRCLCNVQLDETGTPYLEIDCAYFRVPLKTTNIVLPRRVFQTYDINYITINILIGDTNEIPSPAISSQLSSKLRSLIVHCDNQKIDHVAATAFDNLPIFESLQIIDCQLINDVISSDWLTAKLGKTLRSLTLINNKLTRVPSFALRKLSLLKTLNLRSNQIDQIQPDVFIHFDNLIELNLGNNQLHTIPSDALAKLPNLTSLTMSNNPINEIPPNAFEGNQRLVSLKLTNTLLTEIPTLALNRLKELQEIYLNDNNIRKISSSAFFSLENLTFLELSNCQISDISTGSFAGLQKLFELVLEHNQLSEIPTSSFVDIPNLNSLRLKDNKINQIRANALQGLKNLLNLDLSENPIEKIDQNGFSGLTKLRTIMLNNINLIEMPIESLSRLSNIKIIFLVGNLFKTIPKDSLYKLNHIREVYLRNNQIDRIENYTFASLGNLTVLDLSSNKIQHIEKDAFNGLLELRELSLSGNKGLKIDDGAFGHYKLENLETLRLLGCELDTLPNSLFQNLPNLWYIYLNNNAFTTIPMTVLKIRRISLLDISSNPILTLPAYIFNNSKVHDLSLNNLSIMSIGDCVFCGLTVQLISLGVNRNLKKIHDNAFGYSNNSSAKSLKIKKIRIISTSVETLGRDLLPWKILDYIHITNNPANCNPSMDWLFRDSNLKWDFGREDRCISEHCKKLPNYTPCKTTPIPITHATTIVSSTKKSTEETSSSSRKSIRPFFLFVNIIYLLNRF